ncbi:ABC transporter permease [Parvularcula lutaonensis]|uniref:Transport permease protein n=1 Tax=Parvularcula lutaonensis TaxID=491923 RepID=A0ABV7ME29_9PROT|nr:ABC transporter permease [Parvularcula lutaonensis]GGY53986.1 transport permease protein [Parvularcula lutaonensis]
MTGSFSSRCATSLRVIHALILREISARYAESRAGYLWAILTPIISILTLYFVFALIRQRETEIPLLAFLVTGWFTFGFYQSMVSMIANSEAANKALLMHQNVTRLDVIASRGLLEVLTTALFLCVGGVLAMMVEEASLPDDPLLTALSFFSAGFVGLSVGVLVCAIMTYFPVAMNFINPINRLGFFISGVLFTTSALPSWTYDYVKWNPILHSIEGMRQGWFETYQSPVLDIAYPYTVGLPILMIGLFLERRTRRGIRIG